MQIIQFEEKEVRRFSFAIVSECASQIAVINPTENIQQYLAIAAERNATISHIIRTQEKPDRYSGEEALHEATESRIYCPGFLTMAPPYMLFDDKSELELGKIKLIGVSTQSHLPGTISIVLVHNGNCKAVFTPKALLHPHFVRAALLECGPGFLVAGDKLPTDLLIYPQANAAPAALLEELDTSNGGRGLGSGKARQLWG